MYLEHFGLKAKPFQISADPRFLWLGSKHKEALAILKYGIFDNRGFLLLSGDVGTGKTTLINALLREIGDDTVVATVPDPGFALMDFYRYIARAFRIKTPFETKNEFLEIFAAFLLRSESEKKKVLLIIDEAQRLTSELLEEIRLLSNVEKDYTKLLNIFFVGQNEFNDIILEQQNRPLRQRITINYNIDPLEQHEVMEYINFRLKVAGCEEPLFTGDAVREVFAFSEGYPRLINIVCDHALLTAFVQGLTRITGSIVSECADELRIKSVTPAPAPEPAPWPQPAVAPPTVYASASPESDRGKGLSSAQTLLVVIIGLLCFVAGLMIFSLRGSGTRTGAAGTPSIEERTPATDQKAASVSDLQPAASESSDAAAAASASAEKTVPPDPAVEGIRGDPSGAPAERSPISGTVAHTEPASMPERDAASAADALPHVPLEDLIAAADALTVNFKIDSNELTPEDMRDLDRIAIALRDRDDVTVTVKGYTDTVGNYHYNLKVSEFRANIVKTYLVGRGVPADRITARGLGPADPLASNDTLEGRRRNRRVEMELQTSTEPATE